MAGDNQTELTKLTVELLSAYLTNNVLPSSELPALIASTRASLSDTSAAAAAPVEQFAPAVSIRKSLASKDVIISLIDGKPYKTLKRHLTTHGLTPDEYRSRYNLSASYPMVAPSYSERRREVAAANGLGRLKGSRLADKREAGAAAPKTKSVAAKGLNAAPAKGDAVPKAKAPRAKSAIAAKPSRARVKKASVPAARSDGTATATPSTASPEQALAAAKPARKVKIAVGGDTKPKVAKEKSAAPKTPRAKKALAPIAETAAPAIAAAKWDDKIPV